MRRPALVVWLVVSSLAGAFCGLATIAGAVSAATARHPARGDTSAAVVGAAVLAVLTVGFVVAAVHAWHLLHRDARRRPPTMRRARIRRPPHPAALIVYAVLFVGATVGFAIGAGVMHGEAGRSSRTQHRGISDVGVVEAVHVSVHHSRSSTWYTSTVDLALAAAVDGRSTTVLHVPFRTHRVLGDRVSVLVDPQDAGYAEYAGSPAVRAAQWIALTVMAAFCLGIAVLMGVGAVKLRRRGRAPFGSGMALPPPPPATAR